MRNQVKVIVPVVAAILFACPSRLWSAEDHSTIEKELSWVYNDTLADHYPELLAERPTIPAGVPIEKEVLVLSPSKSARAILVRSDGTQVPYEIQIAVLTVQSKDSPPRYMLLKGFRNIDFHWISERILYISVNVGHMAGVEAILDASAGIWLYRQSVMFYYEE